uniref:ATP synthase subunit a n=1 Tax=Epimeria cornigera TaxID=1582882 RepID=A0A2S1TMB9_9CRUS|nr:ATP synthase F0 subunit 6 [Epimeria cornigera]
MMTNLFSIFDPSTPNFLSSNWMALFIFLLNLPAFIWLIPNRTWFLFNNLYFYLYSEFQPLIKKSPFILILPLSFFMFIMINNLMGLFPYIFTPSSHMIFTLTLSLPSWLALMMYGWLHNTQNLLAHLVPQGTPTLLMPFMVLIETISSLIRPITLSIRLAANMIAGHLLITLLSSAFLSTPFISTPILLMAQVSLTLLELAVAFIQAYVFTVLVTLYAAELAH